MAQQTCCRHIMLKWRRRAFSVLHFSLTRLLSQMYVKVEMGRIYHTVFSQKWTKLLINNCCNGITQSLTKHNTIANRSSAIVLALIFSAIFCPIFIQVQNFYCISVQSLLNWDPIVFLKAIWRASAKKSSFFTTIFLFKSFIPPFSISPFFTRLVQGVQRLRVRF